MAITIKVDLGQPGVLLPLRYPTPSKTHIAAPTRYIYLTYGHLRPSSLRVDDNNPVERYNKGKKQTPGLTPGLQAAVNENDPLGFIEEFGPGEEPPGGPEGHWPPEVLETRLFYMGRATGPHLHLTMTTSSVADDYFAGTSNNFDIYLDVAKALPIIKQHMK